ncbi:hypothetical protein PNOK_0407400 [Pyrrhoderma noxium]|uniref:Uncharacterized protein n=1 Tax=Pyrrhoderma noxium TaxID=2282107 RepID=A0A286UPC5_9AGAM|nr:hypothetical protein PNOK_0407400 [Pyrrhoderma noxium]
MTSPTSSTNPYVLLQYGVDPFNYEFETEDEQTAFTVTKAVQIPNMVIHLIREERWAVQYPEIMGPRNAFFYFGPSSSPGQLAYGNGEPAPMLDYLQKKREGSNSRYFTSQNGKKVKWKSVSSQRMELWDGRNLCAVWEKVSPGFEYDAKVTFSQAGLSFVTEVLTTLTLNLAAKRLDFW